MEATHHLEKRHGTALHAEVASTFALVVFGLIVLYSLVATINARAKFRFNGPLNIVTSPIFLVVLWTGLCVGAIFWHFKADMLQIARRYGQLAIASATITVMLSLKPGPLPQTFHASLVPLHKWVGRSSILFALIHGVTYSISFILAAHKKSSHHDKRHKGHHHHPFSTFNIFGMISLAAFVIILLSSLKIVRTRSYGVFYALHRPLVILIYILMIWHARPSAWIMVTLGLVMLAAQMIARALLTCRMTVSKAEQFGSSLKLVTFDCDSGLINLSADHGAGTYIRVTRPIFSPIEFFRPSHPYTLAGPRRLVVRESRFQIKDNLEYCAVGPFHSSLHMSPYSEILIVAGGSGISMAPSVISEFANPDHLRLVWVTRESAEAGILAPLGIENCSVYVTAEGDGGAKDDEETYELDDYEIEGANEEEEDAGLLPTSTSGSKKGIHKFRGRPPLNEIVNSFSPDSSHERDPKLLIVTCGPESLVKDVKKWASRRHIDCWSEVYAL